jgi:hypothetical protein
MTKFTIGSFLLAGLSALSAWATEPESKDSGSSTSTSVERPKATPAKDDEADELITNRMMRASNGSLSKFSLNTGMTYQGGSLNKPFAADRPNIAAAGDATSISGISGTFNGSYRLSAVNRLNLGAGLQMLAPFNDSINTRDARAQQEFDENQGQLDISNPFLSFTHMNKVFGVQTIVTTTATLFTAGNLRDAGYQNSADITLNTMYNVGDSGFSFGALFLYSQFFFNKNDANLLRFQNEVVYGFMPQAEYVINDTFNLRTIVRSNWYQNTRANSDFVKRPVTQSAGLGISVSRDVFLYPNIQFAYDDFGADRTNVGFTANINML